MKYAKPTCLVLMTIMILLGITMLNVSAMNTGFSTQPLQQEDASTFLKNTRITMLTNEPTKNSIKCFDANEHGMVAIGHDGWEEKTVCIYNSNGVFQYGYSFNTNGSFGLEWDKENLNIYFVRSDVIVSVSPSGEKLAVLEVPYTFENNLYINHYIHATERIIGNYKYSIKNDMGILNFFTTSYSQLVITNANGEENIIYDVNSNQLVKTALIIGVFVLMFFIALFLIIRQIIYCHK